MERDRDRPGPAYGAANGLRAEQLYAQLTKLSAGMEELKNGMRAIRRQLDAEAARNASRNEGEENA